MRLRALVPWILLPPLVLAALACWFTVRAVANERASVDALTRTALGSEAATYAYGWAVSETTSLAALDAFTSIPAVGIVGDTAEIMRTNGRDANVASLDFIDHDGEAKLDSLRATGDVSDDIRFVLSPLDADVYADLRDGRTAFLDPEPYANALRELQNRTELSPDAVEEANQALLDVQDRPPYWRSMAFAPMAATLVALALGGGLLALWRFTATSRGLGRRGETRAVVDLARRLSTSTDLPTLARTLVEDVAPLVGSETVVLVLRDGAQLVPHGATGPLAVRTIAVGDGALGRCVETGALVHNMSPSDPLLADGLLADGRAPTPVTILAAPLVVDGHAIGAVAALRHAPELFDEASETTIQLVAVLAAGAVAAARRFDSTLALALNDPLTGIGNRRQLEHDLSSAAATEARAAFLMVDIDHFKAFNDRYGHIKGDELLRSVAHAIVAAVREEDEVYRYGGEEFSVLLPGADAADATLVAERVRHAVQAAARPAGCDATTVTVSVGAAAQVAPLVPAALVDQADTALYHAKQNGRDQVVLSPT